MKSCSAQMAAHIQQGQTTFTTLIKLKRQDGTVFGFTELDQDVVFDDASGDGEITYQAEAGFQRFNLNDKSDLSSPSVQMNGMIDGTIITRSDIVKRKFDYPDVQVSLVNWSDLTQGRIILHTGKGGTVTINEFGFSLELYGLSELLSRVGGETISPTCRVDLGSPKCGVNVTALMQSGTVTATDGGRAITASGITGAEGYFSGGLLTWLTGNNAGLSTEVKIWDGTDALNLFLKAFDTIQVGDTFKLQPACAKTVDPQNGVPGCKTFDNVINFQGEPHVPNPDTLANPDFRYPHQ